MKIKQGNGQGNFVLRDFLFGGNDASDTSLNNFIAFLTFGVFIIIVVIMLLTYILGGTTKPILELVNLAALIAGVLMFAAAIIGLFAKDEWNTKFGLRMWLRLIALGVIFISVSLIVEANQSTKQIIEPVKKMDFLITDKQDCIYMIRMGSENFNYEYCPNIQSDYNNIKNSDIEVDLVVRVGYGSSRVDHIEIKDSSRSLK